MAVLEERRTVHARVPYVFDKEIHVSTVQSPQDGLFVDLREYIPSKDFYGRGITFPIDLMGEILAGFESVWHENGAGEFGEDSASGKAG